jgi:hypothetical protein
MDEFLRVYEEVLRESIAANPEMYAEKVRNNVSAFVASVRLSVESGYGFPSGHTFAATCKRLGIKPTTKGLREFCEAHQ